MYYKIKITVLFLITGGAVNIASAQVFTSKKVGDNPFTIKNKSAVLEVESTTGGFLPPRMKMIDRNKISSPPPGLIIWCDDCNKNPPFGGLCVYLGESEKNKGGWVSLPLVTTPPELTTGKMTDDNKPVKLPAANSVRINGTLVHTFGFPPVETGVVWREITGNDFVTLPVLDAATGEATPPARKTTGALVTADGALISVDITGLTSKKPYYFRTYARTSPWSIGYGNAVIFNIAAPAISTPVVTNTAPLAPTFSGTLTVNASTPPNTVTAYGYWSSTIGTDPTKSGNKVQLSTPEALATLNTQLSAETFTENPTVDLPVNNYDVKAIVPTYFRYYVKADGVYLYSPVASFTPLPDPVTGGTARAVLTSNDPPAISKSLKAGEFSTSSFKVKFNVTKAGSYNFVVATPTGTTTGLTMPDVKGDFLTTGDNQELTFNVNGLPKTSLSGNTFTVAGAALNTGAIQLDAIIEGNIVGGNALCGGAADKTTIAPVFSPKTGRIWMDRNLGASQAATSSTDYLAYGCLYQWGRGNDGHASIIWTSATAGATGTPVNGSTNTLATTDTPGNALFINAGDWRSPQNNNLWQGVNGINNPCPADYGYRIPVITELMAEGDAYSITNKQKAFESDLKFVPIPWRREYDLGVGVNTIIGGILVSNLNEDGTYWSSSVSGVLSSTFVCFDGIPVAHYRYFGYSVRCIKNQSF